MIHHVSTCRKLLGSASENVTQTVEYVEQNDKLDHLMRFLLTIQEGLILIFVETKRNCDYVEDILCERGFPACSIHGDKSQREREDALRAFKTGRCPVLVATDVAVSVVLEQCILFTSSRVRKNLVLNKLF